MPFENSSNGSVVFTLDLLADLAEKHPDILVCGETYVAVKHCLLGRAPKSPENVQQNDGKKELVNSDGVGTPRYDLSMIKRLYSHPQAWGQCTAFLDTYMKGVERFDVSSTSKAAELVAQDTSGESAALSSIVAAQHFHLDVLAETINDRVNNTTRFLIIRHKHDTPSSQTLPPAPGPISTGKYGMKSLVTFTVDHANPGALAQCLAVFAKHGLNLTSINSRPSGVENWNYVFFVEMQGSKTGGGEGVEDALRELEGVCRGARWLGSWESGS